MAQALIFEFDGLGRDDYDAVNAAVGIDTSNPDSDWPAGILYHAAAAKPGGWVVFEVWESQAAQEQFMYERLGAALAGAGVASGPSRAQWLDLAAHTPITA